VKASVQFVAPERAGHARTEMKPVRTSPVKLEVMHASYLAWVENLEARNWSMG
jgi:hypothetical protein